MILVSNEGWPSAAGAHVEATMATTVHCKRNFVKTLTRAGDGRDGSLGYLVDDGC